MASKEARRPRQRRGSNLQALLAAQRRGELGGEIAVVFSNVAEAPALDHARRRASGGLSRPPRPSSRGLRRRAGRDPPRTRRLLVCLAGYCGCCRRRVVRAFAGRIVNVHPALLPAFPGLAAAAAGPRARVRVSGATVHLVDEGLDSGPIVEQEAVNVLPLDTPESLAARILEVEHRDLSAGRAPAARGPLADRGPPHRPGGSVNPQQAYAYLTKGAVDVVTAEALKAKLALGRPLTVKVGFDPTAPTSTSATRC